MKSRLLALISLASLAVCVHAAAEAAEQELLKRYTGMLEGLRTELTAKVPTLDPAKRQAYDAAAEAVVKASDQIKKAERIKDQKDLKESRGFKGQ